MGKDVSGEVVSLTGDENKVIPLSSLRSPVSRVPKTKQDINLFPLSTHTQEDHYWEGEEKNALPKDYYVKPTDILLLALYQNRI